MFTCKTLFTALLALILTTGATLAKDKKRPSHKGGEIFQNVDAEHVRPLLANTARVTRLWDDEGREQGGYARIVWYGADGREHSCLTDFEGVSGVWEEGIYSGRMIDAKRHSVRYPLKEGSYSNGKKWYQLLRYNGET
ncbi:hypothetical protein, partial [Ruegeria atlantica]|uniref:hypothetical protein n=1 Tax=Ruegeria atlantica TaxID=81569 RepID=UPI00147987B8